MSTRPVPKSTLQASYEAKMLREGPALGTLKAEPIAIVGWSCRLTQDIDHPNRLWERLLAGGSLVGPMPTHRLDLFPMSIRPEVRELMRGTFLDRIDEFDSGLFGIAPREADSIDPQQRLLMELAWEALENAGRLSDRLAQERVGLFVGISTNDYAQIELHAGDRSQINAYSFTGVSPSMASGRISYVLGLRGPSLSIDTACSSSLVAIHYACQSLRLGESDSALAAGVNLILLPDLSIYLRRVQALSATHECRTLDAAADGYVRGEGGACLMLRRLSDAISDGDRIVGVIRSSAVNHDGRSSGLTVPNRQAQVDVIRESMNQAGIDPSTIDYVELHGTGTPLGDPIEVVALLEALSRDGVSRKPVRVGSVKANIGHLEAAAGIVGLIKAAQIARHGEVTPQPLFERINPALADLSDQLKISRTRESIIESSGESEGLTTIRCGVSSFGFSGTNAHAIVESPPLLPRVTSMSNQPATLVISAESASALGKLIANYRDCLRDLSANDWLDFCFTAAVGRRHLRHRVALVADTPQEASGLLDLHLRGEFTRNVWAEKVGHQHRLGLMIGDLNFHDSFQSTWGDRVDSTIGSIEWADDPPSDLSERSESNDCWKRLASSSSAGAGAVRLITLLASIGVWGIRPRLIWARGAGKLVAASLAGVLSEQQSHRMFEQWFTSEPGSDEHRQITERLQDRLSASPTHSGLAVHFLADSMDAMSDSLIVSSVSSAVFENEHISDLLIPCDRESLEVGMSDGFNPARLMLSLSEPPDWVVCRCIAAHYVRGIEIDFFKGYQSSKRRRLELPRYPFERRKHWSDFGQHHQAAVSHSSGSSTDDLNLTEAGDRLTKISSSSDGIVAMLLDYNSLEGHRLNGVSILPGAAVAAVAAECAMNANVEFPFSLKHLQLLSPISWKEIGSVSCTIESSLGLGGRLVFAVQDQSIPTVTRVAVKSRVGWSEAKDRFPFSIDPSLLLERVPVRSDADIFYQQLESLGLDLDLSLRGVRRFGSNSMEGVGFVSLPKSTGPMRLDPVQLDSALHVACFLTLSTDEFPIEAAPVPVSIDRWNIYGFGSSRFWVHARFRQRRLTDHSPWIIDMDVYTDDGRLWMEIWGLRVELSERKIAEKSNRILQHFWKEQSIDLETATGEQHWLVLGSEERCKLLSRELEQRRVRVSFRDGLDNLLPEINLQGLRDLTGILDVRSLPLLGCNRASDDGGSSFDAVRDWLAFARELCQLTATPTLRVIWATSSPESTSDVCVDEAMQRGAMHGLMTIIPAELPTISCKVVEVAGPSPSLDAEMLAIEVAALENEPFVLCRNGDRYVRRVGPVNSPLGAGECMTPQPYELSHERGKGFDGLSIQATQWPVCLPGKVIVRNKYSSLNFIDVMDVMGLLPFKRSGLGIESAGVVCEVGEGVSHLAVGDRVVYVGEGCFASHACVDAHLTVRLPDRIDLASASTIAASHLTVWYAFNELIALTAGQTVLIHSATGGLGLAAIAQARSKGLVVFATAGSPRRRRYLRELGIENVYDSRTPRFCEQILAKTGGRGVDLALNSLTGDLLDATIRCVRDGGIIAELGKSDRREAGSFPRGIRSHVVAIDQLCRDQPARVGRWLTEIVERFVAGEIPPLPYTLTPISSCSEAFRSMAFAKHIGKILIAHPTDNHSRAADGTCLITGGTGGLGGQLMEYLVERGWKSIAVIARSLPSPEWRRRANDLAERGVRIEFFQGDVSNRLDVTRSLSTIRGKMPKLKGIFHLAGSLNDALISNQTWERCETAIQVKGHSAWILHDATLQENLSFFVLFSSIASMIDSAGQSSYAMANAILDDLARYRYHRGWPAMTIHWGPWSSEGMAHRQGHFIQRRWDRLGIGLLSSSDALKHLDVAMSSDLAECTIANFGQQHIGGLTLTDGKLFSDLAANRANQRTPTNNTAGTRFVAHSKVGLEGIIRQEIITVLGCQESDLDDRHEKLNDLGLDSLMSMDLTISLARRLHRELPRNLIKLCPTIAALVDFLGNSDTVSNGNETLGSQPETTGTSAT